MSKDPPPYVSKADGNEIIVKTTQASAGGVLTRMDFTAQPGSNTDYIFLAQDDKEKARLFGQLRDAGFCFSRGKEWNPSEVFEWLKDQGLLHGSFRSIAWRGPDDWFLKDEQ